MIFKYEFMQSDWVPVEHLEMDKRRRMEFGTEELARKVLENYPYQSRVAESGHIIDRLLIYHPGLQYAVAEVLREMDEPEKNTEVS